MHLGSSNIIFVASNTALKHQVLVIDGSETVGEEACVVLIEHSVRLAVACAERLGRSLAEIPEGSTVGVNVHAVADLGVETHAAL